MSDNTSPSKYRVDENGELLNMKPTYLKGAFIAVAVVSTLAVADYLYDRCGNVGQFIYSDCNLKLP